MPRPALPPTPGSSSDIRGKDGVQQLSALQLAFELPPPAIHDASSSSSPVDPKLSPLSSAKRPPSSAATSGLAGLDVAPSPRTVVYPMQAAETVKSRRRSSAATTTKESSSKANTTTSSSSTFALPPPPTRSRKIIQMKPRTTTTAGGNSASTTTTTTKESSGRANITGRASAAAKTAAPDAAGPGAGGAKGGEPSSNNNNNNNNSKKKQPSATSAAGRKIARKTAHSLIERRRRSKMNEEFALLKSMIPACTGEMHKLAILQASIEYVRYLEDCVAKLKAQQEQQSNSRPEASSSHSPLPPIREFHPTFRDEDPVDVEMMTDDSDAAAPSPVFAAQQQQHLLQNNHHQQQEQHRRTSVSVSPALHAQDSRHRQHSYSSASTAAADQRHYSFSASTTTTSPAFGPQLFAYNNHAHGGSASGSTLTSPALLPQTDLDHEATAALLMLNCDRRGTVGRNGSANNVNRALSVRDLLSS
ncbi:hypothetical protein V8C44DRAFT_358778 [Trichoderma aethiopicum]